MYILELILIVFLLFVFSLSFVDNNQSPEDKILMEVNNNLRSICNKININPKFNLYNSDTSTYVEDKKNIYLVTRDKNNNLYDKNTINKAAIHELAHVLSITEDHGELFKSTENYLLKTAAELKICDPSKKINSRYPCLDARVL